MGFRLLFILFLFQYYTYAQLEDAWVYLNDKPNYEYFIENPLLILSQKSINMKSLKNIPIDFRDAPVNESYIETIDNFQGLDILSKSKWFNCLHVRGDYEEIDQLRNLDFVDRIEYANRSNNRINKTEIEDKFVKINYDLINRAPLDQIQMINLDFLHSNGFTGSDISVGVFDAGFRNVDTMEGFLRLRSLGNIKYIYDFVDRTENLFDYNGNSHGTNVLSIIAGYIENEYYGTAIDAEFYLFRTEDVSSENPVEESYWVEAMERADSLGIDIANTSLGYRTYDNSNYSYSQEEMDGATAFITKGCNIAYEKGIILVNSAGNSSVNGVIAPADSKGVLSIGAVDGFGNYASFSSQGNNFQQVIKPDISARGSGTYLINSLDNLVQGSGTSYSSPIIAGSIACLLQAFPTLKNNQIMNIIRYTASQFQYPDYYLGYGIPNFELAYQLALNAEKNPIIIFPNPVDDILNIVSTIDGYLETNLFDMSGKLLFSNIINGINNVLLMQNFQKGIYILEIKSEYGDSEIFRLVKK
jgi:subtilisin family serine protease